MAKKDIAEHVGVSASTICREIERNKGLRDNRHKQAYEMAVGRRHQASSRPKKMTDSLINVIAEKLGEKWSP